MLRWLRVVDWYDSRSGIVHGEYLDLDEAEIWNTQHWIFHDVLPPVLQWLADHEDDPIGALERAINALPDPPDWESILAAQVAGQE
jgi:hypothetical protein